MLKVIGIGSPFGDDQIGILLIDELRQTEKLQSYLGSEVELLALDRPGASLLAHFEGVKYAVLIDAVVSGAQPGLLHCWGDPAAFKDRRESVSSHGLGLAQALSLGQALNQLPERLLILGVEIDPGEKEAALSQSLQAKIPELITVIAAKLIESIRKY